MLVTASSTALRKCPESQCLRSASADQRVKEAHRKDGVAIVGLDGFHQVGIADQDQCLLDEREVGREVGQRSTRHRAEIGAEAVQMLLM